MTCLWPALREKCPGTGFYLVRIFLYSDWIRKFFNKSPFSVQIGENRDQKKTRYLDIFTQGNILICMGEFERIWTRQTWTRKICNFEQCYVCLNSFISIRKRSFASLFHLQCTHSNFCVTVRYVCDTWKPFLWCKNKSLRFIFVMISNNIFQCIWQADNFLSTSRVVLVSKVRYWCFWHFFCQIF